MKRVISFLMCIPIGLIVAGFAAYGAWTLMGKVEIPYEPSSRVLVTAAHLGDIEGYTCVYSDEESDVGVYIEDGYVAKAPPAGAEVTYLNSHGIIYSVSDSEFLVDPFSFEAVIPGVSGSPVYYRGVPIGFISGWDGAGHVRCIFY